MSKSLIFLVLIFNALLYVSAGVIMAEVNASKAVEDSCSNDVEKLIEAGNAAFTGKFLYEAMKESSDKNLIMSPYSVFTPFAQLALYADGETRDQLLKVLNVPNKNSIRCVFPKLISKLRAEQNVVLNVASKIYSTGIYPLSTEFQNDTKAIFDSEADFVDIGDPEGAAAKINKWVEDQTNKRIKDLASPSMINAETRLILANAIYFLGNWNNAFDELQTTDRTFHSNNTNSIEIPTMYQKAYFKYGENNDLHCKVLIMPYKGGKFSFVVFLPNDIEGLSTLVENLQDPDKFYKAFDGTKEEEVKVYIPKIKTESEYDLKSIMYKAGIKDILDGSKSNLNGILEKYEPLHISAAKQKAFIDINETGTEAAAANIFVAYVTTSVAFEFPFHKDFVADHPFAYYIMHQRNILFSGVFKTG